MLTLYEDLYLLALDDEKGNFFSFTRKAIAYPLAGAILAELALAGKLGLGEKLRLVASGAEPAGDPILDGVWEQFRLSEKPRKPAYWVHRLSEEPQRLRLIMGERLVQKNVLLQDEKRFYRPAGGVQQAQAAAPDKYQMKLRLRASVLSTGESDLRSLVLLKMVAAGDLLGLVFTLDEIEMAGRMIQKQFLTAALQSTIMQVVEEIEQAVRLVREDEMD